MGIKLENKKLLLDNAEILPGNFKNFSGGPDKFNPNGGKRYFNVIIDDDEIAEQLKNDGWNVKPRKSRDGEILPTHYLKIQIGRFINSVQVISGNKRRELIPQKYDDSIDDPAEKVSILDRLDIESASLVVTPSYWSQGGREGYSAYLNTGIFKLQENPFAYMLEGTELINDDEEDMDDIPF